MLIDFSSDNRSPLYPFDKAPYLFIDGEGEVIDEAKIQAIDLTTGKGRMLTPEEELPPCPEPTDHFQECEFVPPLLLVDCNGKIVASGKTFEDQTTIDAMRIEDGSLILIKAHDDARWVSDQERDNYLTLVEYKLKALGLKNFQILAGQGFDVKAIKIN